MSPWPEGDKTLEAPQYTDSCELRRVIFPPRLLLNAAGWPAPVRLVSPSPLAAIAWDNDSARGVDQALYFAGKGNPFQKATAEVFLRKQLGLKRRIPFMQWIKTVAFGGEIAEIKFALPDHGIIIPVTDPSPEAWREFAFAGNNALAALLTLSFRDLQKLQSLAVAYGSVSRLMILPTSPDCLAALQTERERNVLSWVADRQDQAPIDIRSLMENRLRYQTSLPLEFSMAKGKPSLSFMDRNSEPLPAVVVWLADKQPTS